MLLWSLERCFTEPQISSLYPAGGFQNGVYPCLIFYVSVFLFGVLAKKTKQKIPPSPPHHKKYQEMSRSPTVSSLDKEGIVLFLQNTLVMARVFA